MLANRWQYLRNSSEAAKWDEEAARLAAQWVESEPGHLEALDAAQLAFLNRGTRLETAGQPAQARESFERAVHFAERANAIGAADHHTEYILAFDEYVLADMLLKLKEIPATVALTHAERALALMEPLHQLDAANLRWTRTYQMALSSVGIAHRALASSDPKHLQLAIQFLERAHRLAGETMRADPKNESAKDAYIVQCNRLARCLAQAGKADAAGLLYEEAGQAAREMIALDPKSRRNWHLLAKNQLDYGAMRLGQRRLEQARQLLVSADPALARGFALDPQDAVLLEARAAQLKMLAEAAEQAGDRRRAQEEINRCLDVLSGMVQRDAAAREYVGDYKEMLALARRLGVSTRDLQ